MAAPLILARTFADAHRFAREELGLSIGYYRVVNSAGTIKACRNVDIFLVEGWDKRPDRFTMKSALKWCRLNIRDVEAERKSAAEFDAAMPPTPPDTSVHWVNDLAFVHDIADPSGVQTSKDKADVTCDICLAAIEDLEPKIEITVVPDDTPTPQHHLDMVERVAPHLSETPDEPAGEMPEPAEAEEATPEPAPIDEAEPEIVVAEDNRQSAPESEEAPEPEPTDPPKRRRRTRCKDCGTLHFKGEPCPEAD